MGGVGGDATNEQKGFLAPRSRRNGCSTMTSTSSRLKATYPFLFYGFFKAAGYLEQVENGVVGAKSMFEDVRVKERKKKEEG